MIRATDVLPLVPATWMLGYARCGEPSSSISAAIRVGARLDFGLRPALVEQVLDLQQRRDLVGVGPVSGRRSVMQAGQAGR